MAIQIWRLCYRDGQPRRTNELSADRALRHRLRQSGYYYHDRRRYPESADWEFAPRQDVHLTARRLPWMVPAQQVIEAFKKVVLDPAGVERSWRIAAQPCSLRLQRPRENCGRPHLANRERRSDPRRVTSRSTTVIPPSWLNVRQPADPFHGVLSRPISTSSNSSGVSRMILLNTTSRPYCTEQSCAGRMMSSRFRRFAPRAGCFASRTSPDFPGVPPRPTQRIRIPNMQFIPHVDEHPPASILKPQGGIRPARFSTT